MKLAWLCAWLPFVGCAQRECPPPKAAVRGEASTVRAALARLENAASVDVLVISGGGSRGAFTAGILTGLRDSGKRPRYGVVTGVSTGALLASHAFLGQPEDDAVLAKTYTTVTNSDIFRTRSILAVPFSDSLTTLKPLRELIAREVPDSLIDRVAAESGGRAMFVGTVSLDAGRMRAWDMVALAKAKDYETYRAVLLASCSVPGLHPAVYIGGVHHCDGGVREQALLRATMLELARSRAQLTVHVILNGQISVGEVCVQPNLLAIALRSVEVLANASAVGTLWQSYATAKDLGVDWRLARIPDYVPLDFGAQEFVPVEMRRVFEAGRRFVSEGRWEDRPPGVADATRVLLE
jgi:predicted acylesterase/phospholipase RssA